MSKFIDGHGPSKKRRLEKDGLVEMDGPNEVIDVLDNGPMKEALPDSDVIVIDDD